MKKHLLTLSVIFILASCGMNMSDSSSGNPSASGVAPCPNGQLTTGPATIEQTYPTSFRVFNAYCGDKAYRCRQKVIDLDAGEFGPVYCR